MNSKVFPKSLSIAHMDNGTPVSQGTAELPRRLGLVPTGFDNQTSLSLQLNFVLFYVVSNIVGCVILSSFRKCQNFIPDHKFVNFSRHMNFHGFLQKKYVDEFQGVFPNPSV